MQTLPFRTVFISDIHLGSRSSRADELAQFIKRVRCERLYLVGDIIDMWRLRQRWYWPGAHNNVLRRILNHTKHGTEIIFIPGNHDEGARQFYRTNFGGISVLPYAVHVRADGKKLLVTHGDQFDLVVRHSRMVSMLGGQMYDALIMFNRWYNRLRMRLGLPYQSMSKAIKLKVKSACMFISKFEEALMNEAKRRDLDGVVCGHIHQAEVREEGETLYYNCGDWVEGATVIVEHHDGRMQLIDGAKAVKAAKAMEGNPGSSVDLEPELAELIRWDPDAMAEHDHESVTFGRPGAYPGVPASNSSGKPAMPGDLPEPGPRVPEFDPVSRLAELHRHEPTPPEPVSSDRH